MKKSERGYADLHDHLDALRQRGLLVEVDRPIDKDAEMHPLVRWQYVGGIEEHERKAFLFTNVVNAQGRKYKFPVVVGAYAGNREIYGVGMGAPLDEVSLRPGPVRTSSSPAINSWVKATASMRCRSRCRRRVLTARRR